MEETPSLPFKVRSKLRLLDQDTISDESEVKLPVLDRFINLLLSLHKPDFYKGIIFQERQFASELGLAYQGEHEGTAQKLLQDPEYMLRY